MPPYVTLTTDYGSGDPFVGICHGVIARICPQARVIDLTHGIAPHDVTGGAAVLATSLPYLPAGVHVAVVDPGVGGPRRAIAVRSAGGHVFVGPDNGLLWPAIQRDGGPAEAFDISRSPCALTPVSPTFHGRDIFAPVAAHIAAGAALGSVGVATDPGTLARLELPVARVADGAILAAVTAIDRFGNVQLGASRADVAAAGLADGPVRVSTGDGAHVAVAGRTFSDVPAGALLLYEESTGLLALAVNRGSAAARLGLTVGAQVRLSAGAGT